jgi:hypothetical protein
MYSYLFSYLIYFIYLFCTVFAVYRAVKKTSPVNLNATDGRGWTALHYVACPLEVGTYDNDELVFVLVKAGAKTDVKNRDGHTPLDLALANNAPKVAAMLQTLGGVAKTRQVVMTTSTFSLPLSPLGVAL